MPGTGVYSDGSSGSLHVQGNRIDSGALTWNDGANGQNVTLSNGYVVNVNLSDVSFVGDSPSGGGPEIVNATFTLVSGPTATVPEPATAGMVGLALISAGWARRRQAARKP